MAYFIQLDENCTIVVEGAEKAATYDLMDVDGNIFDKSIELLDEKDNVIAAYRISKIVGIFKEQRTDLLS